MKIAQTSLECPADGVQVNEIQVRVVAGFVLLTGVIDLVTGWLALPVFLVVDFCLRAFKRPQYSPFGRLAGSLVSQLKLGYKGTDQAPKRFAARIGLAFVVVVSGLQLARLTTILPAVVLVVFAALESLAGFCAGCYVYTFYTRLFPQAA